MKLKEKTARSLCKIPGGGGLLVSVFLLNLRFLRNHMVLQPLLHWGIYKTAESSAHSAFITELPDANNTGKMISDVELRKLKRKKIPSEIEETDYIYSCNHLVTLQT